MTFNNEQISIANSYIQEFYRFQFAGQNFAYTSFEESVTLSGVVYLPIQISRNKIRKNQDLTTAPITVTVPYDLDIVRLFSSFPPSEPIRATVFARQVNDPDQQVVVQWEGRIANVMIRNNFRAEIRCDPITTSLRMNNLRLKFQSQCPYTLYANGCRAPLNSFLLSTTLSSSSGNIISSPNFAMRPDGYYSGGFIVITLNNNNYRRFILNHVQNNITLDFPIPATSAGQAIQVYPGCDHTVDTCRDKFSNLDNYGGEPYIPEKNPFDGTPVF